MLNKGNTFECDRPKARSNYIKHCLRFTEACRIFSGHVFTAPSPQNVVGEEIRYISVGILSDETTVSIIWVPRHSNLRIISARKASKKERKLYNDYLKKKIN